MDDTLKKLNEMCLSYAESLVSPQTEYLHYNQETKEGQSHDTIPLVENFLYILALFKSRRVENMTKAMSLLEKLLVFQNEEGNFPLFLHHYPECKDRYLSFQILAPLYYIVDGFSQILPPQLKLATSKALIKLLDYSLKMNEEKKLPLFMSLQAASSSFAIGKFLSLDEYKKRGESLLKGFKELPKEAFCPRLIHHLIIASTMWDPCLKKSFLKGVNGETFYDHLLKNWHPLLKAYVGPSLLEYQSGFEPESTFLDLFMGYLTKDFSKRALMPAPFYLLLGLIQPLEGLVESTSYPMNFEGQCLEKKYSLSLRKDLSVVFFEEEKVDEKVEGKAFANFKICFGNGERLHTLILQGGNSEKTTISKKGESYQFLFSLADLPEFEEKEKCREVVFYFDLFEGSTMMIEGIRATTFRLGETLSFEVDGFKFNLLFELEEGEGEFLGHYMRGNRPSQIKTKDKDRFSAFDTQIFLRTIRRDRNCVIRATLDLIEF